MGCVGLLGVRIRWSWWVLAAVPALVGVLALMLGVGDFRSSGLVAGISLSLGLVAILLLWRRPWRGRKGVFRWLAPVPGLLLGSVALLGLSQGLPEFLEARGLLVDVDGQGPRAMVGFDGGYVVVGDDGESGVVWFSEDGTNWSQVNDPLFVDVLMRDVILVEGGLLALGEGSESAKAVILSSTDGVAWELAGSFGNDEYGTFPDAIGQTRSGLVVISDIIGNDVEFYRSTDVSSWTAADPVGVFDDGESGSDIACNEDLCVGVGDHDATYRAEIESNTGVAWTISTGDRFDLVDHHFQSVRLTAIAWTESGFLTVGDNSTGEGVAWQSHDGRNWTSVGGPFNNMTIDGVAAVGNRYVIFGTNPTANELLIWTSDTGNQWDQETISDDFAEGSQIRTITENNGTRIAIGIASDTLDTIIWTSTNNQPWQHTTTLETRQTS